MDPAAQDNAPLADAPSAAGRAPSRRRLPPLRFTARSFPVNGANILEFVNPAASNDAWPSLRALPFDNPGNICTGTELPVPMTFSPVFICTNVLLRLTNLLQPIVPILRTRISGGISPAPAPSPSAETAPAIAARDSGPDSDIEARGVPRRRPLRLGVSQIPPAVFKKSDGVPPGRAPSPSSSPTLCGSKVCSNSLSSPCSSTNTFSPPSPSSSGCTSPRPSDWRTALHQMHHVLRLLRRLHKNFEDRTEIANRDLLPQQLLQHALYLPKRHQLRNKLFDQLWMRFIHAVQKTLYLLPSQQLMRMSANQFAKMCSNHRRLVYHRVTRCQRLLLEPGLDPPCLHAKRWLPRLHAGQHPRLRIRIHRQQAVLFRLPTRNLYPPQTHDILSRLQSQVVRNVNRRNDEPELGCQMPPQRTDPVEHLPTLLLIHYRNQLEPDLQRQLIHLQQRSQIFALRCIGGLCLVPRRCRSSRLLHQHLRSVFPRRQSTRNQPDANRHQHERQLRQSWNQGQSKQHAARDPKRISSTQKLRP